MKYTRQNPSPQYQEALAEAALHHATSKTYSGKFLRPHAPYIRELLRGDGFTGPVNILDYGCGKGQQYTWVSHGDDASIPKGQTILQYLSPGQITLFDPAFVPYAHDPSPHAPYDLVLATHVLGSIPVQDLEGWVMPWILEMMRDGGILYIAEKLGDVGKAVFSEPHAMPRWDAQAWREFAQEWSAAETAEENEIVLSLRHRGENETIVERFTYNAGEEKQWHWTPTKAEPTDA